MKFSRICLLYEVIDGSIQHAKLGTVTGWCIDNRYKPHIVFRTSTIGVPGVTSLNTSIILQVFSHMCVPSTASLHSYYIYVIIHSGVHPVKNLVACVLPILREHSPRTTVTYILHTHKAITSAMYTLGVEPDVYMQ